MKNKYELTILLKTSASSKDVEKLISDIKEIIKKEGKILKEEDMGKRRLAYSIRKENEANFRLITLETMGADLALLSSKIRMEEAVLRHLFIRIDEPKVPKTRKKKE